MQAIGFGQVKRLAIRNGDPQPDPTPEVVVEWKFGAAENGPRPESRLGQFTLKSQVSELFERLDQLGDVVIDTIEVRHGLPFRLITTQRPPT